MNFRRLCTYMLIAGGILAASSCKDKEEDVTVSPSLNGPLSFQIELQSDPETKIGSFIAPETKVKMTPTGLTHPEGKGIGYYWKVTPDMDKPDTTRLEADPSSNDGSFTYTFPKELNTYSVACTGFAAGYSSSYKTKYVTTVKAGLDGSVTGTGILKNEVHETYGGVDYYYTSHNGLDWMRINLADRSSGAAYTNADVMSNVFGRYYSYNEAKEACPEGWGLPTDEDWRELAASINGKELAGAYETIPSIAAELMADAKFNDQTMWEYWPEVVDIMNSAKLAVIPVGYANLGVPADGKYPTASFKGVYEYAAFWTADPVEGDENMAYYRYLICDQPDMYVGKGDTKTFGASVRCVRPSVNQ